MSIEVVCGAKQGSDKWKGNKKKLKNWQEKNSLKRHFATKIAFISSNSNQRDEFAM